MKFQFFVVLINFLGNVKFQLFQNVSLYLLKCYKNRNFMKKYRSKQEAGQKIGKIGT